MNTSIKQKKQFWPQFIKACESQWIGGGERYALKNNKEFTDLICEAMEIAGMGEDWIAGNIIKYCGEIMNEKRAGNPAPEVNFFKIAVWSFIWWLKHLDKNVSQRDKGEEFSK